MGHGKRGRHRLDWEQPPIQRIRHEWVRDEFTDDRHSQSCCGVVHDHDINARLDSSFEAKTGFAIFRKLIGDHRASCGCVRCQLFRALCLAWFAGGLVLCPLTTVDLIPAADEVGFVVSLVLFLPIYSLKQFILGFPDREILMPTPDPYIPTSVDLAGLRDAVGSVTVTLRPYGKVEVDGIEYAATSVGGQLVERGSSVRVSDIRNSVLVVTEPQS